MMDIDDVLDWVKTIGIFIVFLSIPIVMGFTAYIIISLLCKC